MGKRDELVCPTCEADIPLGGDERVGDEVACGYCGAPSIIVEDEEEEWDLEEDY